MSVSGISVIINTLNEEDNIARAIRSVRAFAGEIVVVDMHSDDKTAEIAKKSGAKLYFHERTGYVEPARNFAISKTTREWIFILDADEEVPGTLAKRLIKISEKSEADYYAIPRKNIIFGKWMKYSRWWPDYNIRFFRKGKVEWDSHIHSIPITQGKGADLEVLAEFAIKHHHYTSVEQYVDRMNRYTSIQAKELYKQNHAFNWHDLIRKPTAEFVSRYFAGDGYKYGLHGLALAALQSLSEVVLYIKLWQLNKFNKHKITPQMVIGTIRESQKEMNYWSADILVKNSGSVIEVIRRKFKF